MESEQLKTINQVRKLSMSIIHDVTEQKAYSNLALEKGLRDSKLSQIDKNLTTEIVNGTIRMLKHLDWVLNLFLTKNIDKLNPWIKTILRMTVYQILFMDRIPNYASVNDAVDLARKKTNRNLSGLVNGVLRNLIRNIDNITYPKKDSIDYLSVYYSHPRWLVEMLLNDYGLTICEQILQYNNLRPELHLRVNILKTSREELIRELNEEGVLSEINELSPEAINVNKLSVSLDNTKAYEKGHFYIQNVASMLAVSILQPRAYDSIYDLCSGVGGKATNLAEMMGNQGEIYCFDIYKQKISLLNNNAKRLGINIIIPHLKNALDIDSELAADMVLLDVPCSGLGVLNRRSDLRWNKNSEDLSDLYNLQKELLIKAGQIVKVGGYILYATCTMNKAENEFIVEDFVRNFNDFELVGFKDRIKHFPLDDQDQNQADAGMLTILPGRYQTDGMFYALLKRKDAS
ncbi:MAG TPA: 16S rRNA (cytosine(967)-C(5))-methyltransferase RsmB [Syntrophomonadaceae bacterium]|nr:16S rRNA (cytosine(967)-C(5))-methyltransferase RsmB [Syntrophomonadaceae bacterium]